MPRLLNPDGSVNFERIGLENSRVRDLYHFLLTASWSQLFAILALLYLGGNSLFAGLYLIGGPNIENARPASFVDAFAFSVETMATIGYGAMYPKTLWAHTLVTIEAFVGLFAVALVTGLVFAKFSRPTARVVFSRNAVLGRWKGTPALLFRIANARGTSIVEAQMHVALARDETTSDGEVIRRFYDLPLARERTLLFSLSWTVIHPIAPGGLLSDATPESLRNMRAEIIASMIGFDDAFAQTVHVRHVYDTEDLVWGARFVDMFSDASEATRRRVDFRRFHDLEKLPDNHV